jgi:AAA ATPase domain/Bacterial regulatory protein, Fis family
VHPADARGDGGNVVQAARLLGMSRSALRYRLQRYGLGRSGRRHVSAPRAARDVVATPRHTDGQDEAPSVNAPVPAPSWEQALVEKLQGFGGVLVQHTTSLFLVVFGMPRALEQMPQRAVQAALAIRHLALEARTAPGREPSLEVRQVVHLGPLLVERGTSEPSTRFLAVGETLSLPFRLLGHAAPGEMLVSAPVAPLVAGMCELQARAVSLGTGGGVQGDVYSVLGLVSRHSPLAGLGARSLSRFVGREQELTTLRALLGQVEEGQGQVVGIVGEPGVGKSRLLDEFRRSLAGQRVTYLEGRCLSYGSPMPYGPVLDLLRNHCGIIATESPEAITEKVRVSLGEVGMDPAQGVPYLLHLLGVVAEKEELAVLSPEILKARTCATLRQLTLRGSQEQSLILAVEDLQWIDQTSEDLLASLVESLASTSILLLVTYRPGYHPPWLGKSYATQRVLPPLTPRDSLHVVQAVLQTEQVPASLVQLILAKAEGNPFFLEELVQGLVEQGVLVRTSGSGVTLAEPYRTRPLTEMQLSPTVQGVLAARIDRLEAKAKALLHTLAVIGKAFSWSLLTRIVEQPEAELRLLLAHLQAAEFLYECPAFPEPEYTFKHALTQEMAYSTLPRARRWAVHEHTAQAIEGLFSHRLEEHYSELAHHYSHSRNIPQAVDYLQRAGRQAVQQSAPVEAISHLTQGLELLTSLPDTPRAHPAGTRPARGARASADGHPGLCSPGGRTHLCAGVVRPG